MVPVYRLRGLLSEGLLGRVPRTPAESVDRAFGPAHETDSHCELLGRQTRQSNFGPEQPNSAGMDPLPCTA